MDAETPPPPPPPLPAPEPAAAPRGGQDFPWRDITLAILVGLVTGAGVYAWTTRASLMQSRAQEAIAEQRRTEAEGRLTGLKQKLGELEVVRQQLAMDRDNVSSQAQRTFQAYEKTQAERDLFEDALKATASDRLALLDRQAPLEEQLAELQRTEEQLIAERETLESQLRKAVSHSQEKTLRARLAEMARKESEHGRSLQDARRQLDTMSQQKAATAAELADRTAQLIRFRTKYTEQVTENIKLRHKSDQLPKDVTALAREHERLVKDVADTHYNLGVLFASKRDYVRAEKEFQKVIELRPDDTEAQYNLGVIYSDHLPNREKAMKFFRQYLALNPEGQDASWAKQYIATWQAWAAKERLE